MNAQDKGISFDEFRSVMKNEVCIVWLCYSFISIYQHYSKLLLQLPAEFFQSKFRSIIGKELRSGNGKKSPGALRAAARRLFNSIDLDQNGTLDCHELRLLLRKLGVGEEDISMLVASVDLDKDGKLDFNEFSKVLFGAQAK